MPAASAESPLLPPLLMPPATASLVPSAPAPVPALALPRPPLDALAPRGKFLILLFSLIDKAIWECLFFSLPFSPELDAREGGQRATEKAQFFFFASKKERKKKIIPHAPRNPSMSSAAAFGPERWE